MRSGVRRRRTAVLLLYCPLLLIGLLAGCGGLLPKAPERPLYRLTYSTGTVAAAPTQSPRQVPALLVIATPTASAGLDTKRMAVINSPVGIDYFAEGEWVDRLPFLVKEALIEGFQKSGAFAGVSSEGLGLSADYVLSTDIRDFSATYNESGGAPLARIRIAAELITMPGRNIAAATSVTREARAGANDLPSIVLAFDRALGEAVQDLIAWSANLPAASAKRG
jgi:cholesterol transport system auxiliary component